MINPAAVAALSAQPVDWRFKAAARVVRTDHQRDLRRRPELFAAGPSSPVCVLDGPALAANALTMQRWCAERGVQLAPHGKTHMSPQLLTMQFGAGAIAVTAATISQVRVFRAFGVRHVILANELVDGAGLRWLTHELNSDADFRLTCWVDSVAGVAIMDRELAGLQNLSMSAWRWVQPVPHRVSHTCRIGCGGPGRDGGPEPEAGGGRRL